MLWEKSMKGRGEGGGNMDMPALPGLAAASRPRIEPVGAIALQADDAEGRSLRPAGRTQDQARERIAMKKGSGLFGFPVAVSRK